MKKPCVFLDRDGTLIKEKNYLSDPDEVELYPDAAPSLNLLRECGCLLIVISNQSGIARGYFSEQDLALVNDRMHKLLKDAGAGIDGLYYCPHLEKDNCLCRKPKPGMILRACKDYDIDLSSSFVIGDKLSDALTAVNIGAYPILVTTGYGSDFEKEIPKATFVAANLWEASLHIKELIFKRRCLLSNAKTV